MYWRILCILLLYSLLLACAIPTNRTIDDTFGDLVTGAMPIYVPGPTWQGPSCTGCAIRPPLTDVFMETYSALTYWPEDFPSMSIQFSFQGTAVYVYFILANYVSPGVTTETLANFTLDDQPPVTFHHIPSNSTNYEFNSLVYSQDGLPNTNHTLFIVTSGVDRHLFTSFDYANYTFDDAAPLTTSSSSASTGTATVTPSPGPSTSAIPSPGPSKSTVPVAAIAGGVIGVVILILITMLIYLLLRRRRIAASSDGENTVSTFSIDGSPPGAPSQGPISLPPGFRIGAFASRTVGPPSSVPPPYSDNGILREPPSSESLQRIRQAEIDEQIRNLSQQIQDLAGQDSKDDPPVTHNPSPRRMRRERDLLDLEEQMGTMRGEIEYLQAQLHSDWARGLSDDPPPSYSVAIPPSEDGH